MSILPEYFSSCHIKSGCLFWSVKKRKKEKKNLSFFISASFSSQIFNFLMKKKLKYNLQVQSFSLDCINTDLLFFKYAPLTYFESI